jgi:hypothetical protein
LIPKRIKPEIIEMVEKVKTNFWILGKTTDKLPILFAGLITTITTNIMLHQRKEEIKWIVLTRTCNSWIIYAIRILYPA